MISINSILCPGICWSLCIFIHTGKTVCSIPLKKTFEFLNVELQILMRWYPPWKKSVDICSYCRIFQLLTNINTIRPNWKKSSFLTSSSLIINGFMREIYWRVWKYLSWWYLTELISITIVKQVMMWDDRKNGSPLTGESWAWSIVHIINKPPNGVGKSLNLLSTIFIKAKISAET